MKERLFSGLATMVLVGAVGTSGCGSTSEEENPFLEMLKLVPDTPGTRNSVYISDHAKIREIYDIPLPSSYAGNEAMRQYMMMLVGDPLTTASDPSAGRRLAGVSFVSGMGPSLCYAFVSPIRKQNIGFGPLDVDVDIVAGLPPMTFEAAKGRYDPVVVVDALNNYDEPDSPHHEEYRGIVVYDWATVAAN